MIIINQFFHLTYMRCLIMAKEMYQIFRLQQELITKWIMHPVLIFPCIKIFRYQLLIWLLNQIMILLVAMNMIHNQGYFMLRIIIFHRVKNNGPGAMAISDNHGIET